MVIKRLKKTQDVPRIDILGVGVDDISEKGAADAILSMAKDKQGGHHVVTVNSEMVMLARRDKNFHEILKNADLCVPDGYGVVISKLIFGGKEQERITGIDLIEKLCEKSTNLPVGIGFLGGFRDVAEIVAKRQKSKNPGLKVVFAGPGDPTIGYDSRLKNQFSKKKRIDLLFVAYGMGKQEFWIARNRKKLDVGVFIGVGGAFDYLSGIKKRAPRFLRSMGLEWLWRLIMEPVRIWRMRVLPVFVLLVFNSFFKKTLISYKN